MKRTPEEERIFRALAQIETPEADLSAALRRTEEPRRIRPVRPLAAAAVLCALLTIGAAAVGFFRGVAVLCPLPAPERRADRGGQPDLRELHPHRGGGGGGRQQFYAPAGPDPGRTERLSIQRHR